MYFNALTKETTVVFNKSYNFSDFCELDDEVLFVYYGTSSEYIGYLSFDIETLQVEKRMTNSGIRISNIYKLKNGNALLTSSGSNTGIYEYFASIKKEEQIYSEGGNYKYFNTLLNGNVLISASFSSAGIYLFDLNTNKVIQIYATGYRWDTTEEDENGVTISSSKNLDQGKVYYNFETGTCIPVEDGVETTELDLVA